MATTQISEEVLTDLDIRILRRDEGGYPVEITLGGEQEFPRGYLAAAIGNWQPTADRAADGGALFAALFADARLSGAWAECRGRAPRRRVRLRIDPAAAELHAIPWELMQENGVLLSAESDTPFSRYLPVALPWSGPVAERPVRVLAVIASPDDLQARYGLVQVDAARERQTLQEAVAGTGDLQLDFLDAPVTLERLEEVLRKGYHVLHFLGHGLYSADRRQAALFMQDADGHARRVLDEELCGMLARQGVQPRLVFLDACQSATRDTADAFAGLAPRLVAAGVPAVVAMQSFLTVESAHRLGGTFYARLVQHGQVDLALNEARSALLSAGRADAAVPVLFMRVKSGQLWSAEADARGQVLGAKNPRIFWSGLIRMLQQGKVTPILGPRVHGRWLPEPEDIARQWARVHAYPFADAGDFHHVAAYLASYQGADFPRGELLDTLVAALSASLPAALHPAAQASTLSQLVNAVGWANLTGGDLNEVHRALAALNLPLYITTNADNFMAAALAAQGRSATREVCRWKEDLDGLPSVFEKQPDYAPSPGTPLVYHLMGDDEHPDALALTEDDQLDFLVHVSAESERIPAPIWAALANSSILFLGFALDDWEFRVIMRGLVATRSQKRSLKHVAVQVDLENADPQHVSDVQNFLQQYFQEAEVNVYWGSLAQFVAELRQEWEAARP